jgi:hypothetical protein
MVRTRIRRHLTNQRTDAVAMSVLDQFEVFTIKVWPFPEYQDVSKKKDPNGWKAAKQHLNALERAVHDKAIADSTFNAILNEKDPLAPLGVFFSAPDLAEKVYRAMHNRRATSRRRVAKRKAWMFDSFGSFPIKVHFVKAGLLDKSVLDPKR